MNLDDAFRTSALVKAIDVLSHEQETIAQAFLHGRQGAVAGVWLNRLRLVPAERIEPPDELRIPNEAFRRGHIFDTMLLPQPVRVAERGQAAFRGNTGAGQDKQACFLKV